MTLALRTEGNAAGAQDVLAWQTGYPSAIGLQAGHPRSEPGRLSASTLLARGDADAALVVACDALGVLPAPAAAHLGRIPLITIDAADTSAARAARVAFTPSCAGIHRAGTLHRMDGVPLPLRALAAVGSPGRRRAARRAAGARRGGRARMIRITGGRVHDPANVAGGEVRDVCLDGGRIVADVARARPADRRARHGGHARRRGHPRAHRGAGGERRATAVPRRASRRRGRPHGDHALGHRRHRPVDVGHRLPLLAAGLHDGGRGGDAAAGRPAHARRAARHPADRRRLPRADRQQPGPVRPDAPRAARRHPARARRRRLVARGDRRLRREDRQPRRRGALEALERQRRDARRRGRRAGRDAAPDPRDARDGGPRPRPARTPSTSTATTSASPATGAPRSTPCTRSRAVARTSPTCSSTPTAAAAAAGRARRRRSWPSTSARIRSSAPTSAR